jgi:hypothetical protein
MRILKALARWVQKILDVRLPNDTINGIRPR